MAKKAGRDPGLSLVRQDVTSAFSQTDKYSCSAETSYELAFSKAGKEHYACTGQANPKQNPTQPHDHWHPQ